MKPIIDIEKINQIAIEAGKAIMEIYHIEDFSNIIDFKSDDSPLTLADKNANKIIVSYLSNNYPDIPIISEEEAQDTYETRKNWQYFWLVDPLDGTKEFIKRNGEFTVNIALIYQGNPVAGVIYVPVTEVLYYGQTGIGAFKRILSKTQQIQIEKNREEMIGVGSRSHAAEIDIQMQQKYNVVKNIVIGSSLKFCLVAEGVADFYYRSGPTMEWDIAAGHAIVDAAGGKVINEAGEKFIYNKKDLRNSAFYCLGSIPYLP